MLSTNDVLQNRYRIVRQLGQGGMGAVYEAIDERFGEAIALKEILFDLDTQGRDDEFEIITKAFAREAKSLAKAKHEAVPYVRDYFSEANRQYLVMELVEGDDLAVLLVKRREPFLLKEVVPWMEQLLDALDYLHNLDPPIIHRDIKPQNLKLNFRRKIKLLDFGIAKSIDNGQFTITNQTFVGATLNYSPFEQIIRVMNPTFREFILLKHRERTERILGQNTDARSDIYALGATFYHLLTRRPPLDVVKRTLEVWEGKRDPLPSPIAIVSNIPEPICACLMKALAIDREDRFASAAEMQAALSAAKTVATRSVTPAISPINVDQLPAQGNSAVFHAATQAETERLLDVSGYNFPPESQRIPMPPPSVPILPESGDEIELSEFEMYEAPATTDWSVLPQPNNVRDAEEPKDESFAAEPPTPTILNGVDQTTATAAAIQYQPEPVPDRRRKRGALVWILPLIAICVLGAGTMAAVIWLVVIPSSGQTNPLSNISVPPVDSPTPQIANVDEPNPSIEEVANAPTSPAPDTDTKDDNAIESPNNKASLITRPLAGQPKPQPGPSSKKPSRNKRDVKKPLDLKCIYTDTCKE